LRKDANLNLFLSHALRPAQSLARPKHPLFSHPNHTGEHLTDNDDINMLGSSSIWHRTNIPMF
jgi:hypothetical protein